MCAILDTNTFGRFRNEKDENLEPVRKWLQRKMVKSFILIQKNIKMNGKEGEWKTG